MATPINASIKLLQPRATNHQPPITMPKRTPNPDKLSFEQALETLEDLIEQIESGEIGLEESLQRYEQGAALIKRCKAVLDTAQQKIAELSAGPDGGLTTSDGENQGEPGDYADEGDDDAPF